MFTDTLAVIPQRFPDLDVMRQAAYNLHLMIPFDNPVSENSEEDLRFVFAKIGEVSRTYRWAACVTSQTLAYLVLTVVFILSAFLLALHRRRSDASKVQSLEKRRRRSR